MPHIAITMYPGRDDKAKEDLALKLQTAMMEALNIPPNIISVSVQDVEPDNWKETMKQFPEDILFVKPNI